MRGGVGSISSFLQPFEVRLLQWMCRGRKSLRPCLEPLLLLRRQVLWNLNNHPSMQVPLCRTVNRGQAPSAQAKLLPMYGSCGDADGGDVIERGHGEISTRRSFEKGERKVDHQVVTPSPKQLMGLDMHGNQQVARGAISPCFVASSGKLEFLTRRHACRYVDGQGSLVRDAAISAARAACLSRATEI